MKEEEEDEEDEEEEEEGGGRSKEEKPDPFCGWPAESATTEQRRSQTSPTNGPGAGHPLSGLGLPPSLVVAAAVKGDAKSVDEMEGIKKEKRQMTGGELKVRNFEKEMESKVTIASEIDISSLTIRKCLLQHD